MNDGGLNTVPRTASPRDAESDNVTVFEKNQARYVFSLPRERLPCQSR